MTDDARLQMDPVPAMLTMLIDAADAASDPGVLLHDEVVLTRLDGVCVHGRAAVIDAVVHRGSDARLRTVRTVASGIEVALEIPGVQGHFLFVITAVARDGLLVEITMQ
jgi:hypothetical protein